MPRDATETRNRLRREAERLFARRGVYEATLREITEAAGQRNVSALNYHFGSREGIVQAILEYHGERRGDLYYTKQMLLAVGDRYEAQIAADRAEDAKYR